ALLRHLDLVAVATIADVVPLVDENRGLAIAGLRALASTQKPGLRELMKVARVDPAAVDAASVGFRLAPRLNAAGRLGHPEAALVEWFSAAFAAHAGAHLSETGLLPVTVIDALVHGSELTLELCAELARLAPFGLGNPGVTLLAAGCELSDVAAVGDGKHLRFRVKDGSRDAGSAIAFGFGRQLDRFRRELRFDIAFRLEENHWNGTG